MRKRTLPAAIVTAALFGSVVLTAVPAAADANATLFAIGTVTDTVVDGAHQHIYLSTDGAICVTDTTGRILSRLTGLPGVTDLQLSPDGGTLYAAVTGADKIVAFDTATLAQTAEYPTGAGTAPRRIALTEGRIWFGYGDQWDSGLGEVDLTADPATVTLDLAGDHDFASTPMLYADPANPDTLVALDGGISTGPIVVYDVSSGTPVIRVSANEGGFYRDADFAPDGQSIVVAGPRRDAVTEFRLSDLQAVHQYPVAEEAESVSVAPDGTVAATTFDSADTKLTVDAPASATRAKTLTVKGTLTAGLVPPAGTPLTVVRTDMLSPGGKSLGTRPLGANGTFSFTDVPPAGSTVRYTVTYAGDAAHNAVSASDTVAVSRATPALTLSNAGKTYDYGKNVSFTAHLGSTYTNRTVEIWADPYGSDKPNKLVRTAKVDSKGNVYGTVGLTRDTDVTVVFRGDAQYAPRTVKSRVYTRVKITSWMTKYYKTGKIGKTKYFYFHKNKDAVVNTAMTYYKGRKERLDLQIYYKGKWYTTASEYFPLSTSGRCNVNLGHPGKSGVRARVRAAYLDTRSGDIMNTTTYGAWQYIYFTN